MKDWFSTTDWQPDYPPARDRRVQLLYCDLDTLISDRIPSITVTNNPLDTPACFWIDSDHIYVRVNWKHWCTVSPSSPNHAAALCASHYCRIIHSANNEINEVSAPVYHITELPRDLFVPGEENDADETETLETKEQSIRALANRIPPDIEVTAFPHVSLEEEIVDCVVSNDDIAVLFAVFPEGEDYVAVSRTKDEETGTLNTDEISVQRLDMLVKQKSALQKMEEDAEILMAIIASPKTIESMRSAWKEELEEDDIELVDYSDYETFLRKRFSMEDDDDDAEDYVVDEEEEEENSQDHGGSRDSVLTDISLGQRLAITEEIQAAVDEELQSHDARCLIRFRPERLEDDSSLSFDFLQSGTFCIVLMYVPRVGSWLADEDPFNGEPPLWFSETEHMVSPVFTARKCRDFLQDRLPDIVLCAAVVFPEHCEIINEDDMLKCWHQNSRIDVIKVAKDEESKVPSLHEYLSSLSWDNATTPELDPAVLEGLAEEFSRLSQ